MEADAIESCGKSRRLSRSFALPALARHRDTEIVASLERIATAD
jgi:hypothetical protein